MVLVKRKVKMFGKVKLCDVEDHTHPFTYDKDKLFEDNDEVLWIERGEDEYARPHYKGKPHVVLYRKHWLRGKEQNQ